MANTYLHGLALANYRAIGADIQYLAPFQSVNFIVGPNNVGKSAVLGFIKDHLNGVAGLTGPWGRRFSGDDVHVGASPDDVDFAIGVKPDAIVSVAYEMDEISRPDFEVLLNSLESNGLIWLYQQAGQLQLQFPEGSDPSSILTREKWQRLWARITRSSGGDLVHHWIPQTLATLSQRVSPSFPEVKLIPAIRQISGPGVGFSDFSGAGLIDQLAELQSPLHTEHEKRARFRSINRFLQSVTGASDARIEVPHNRSAIQVEMDGRIFPLASLGTGIHEVVMIASFCTFATEQIVCIEEPELHLHPILQRKLMRYLVANTSNQYFVATHSAALIDSVEASIFAVSRAESMSTYQLASTPADRHGLCAQLGYKASDIIQANAVIWVEGPSDRIYVKRWLQAKAPELTEGIDFVIMFYGGRLLSHLSANDSEVSDFIALQRLNRNVAILIDSDKKDSADPINETKQRLFQEASPHGFVWVTQGKEIENYIAPEVMLHAINEVHSNVVALADDSVWKSRVQYSDRRGEQKTADKVKVAAVVQQREPDFTQLDLDERVSQLAAFLRGASRD